MADKPRPFPANSEIRAQDLKLPPAAPLSLPPRSAGKLTLALMQLGGIRTRFKSNECV